MDLGATADPKNLTRQEQVVQILAPALAEGWLTVKDPVHFGRMLDRLTDEQVYTWARDVLWQHPWPPGLYIPSFSEWVEDSRYMGQVTLTERQRFWFEASIGGHATDWFVKPRKHSMLVLVAGKGSGKDLFAAFLNSYLSYTVHQMRNPWFHFRIAMGEPMDVVNVAKSQRQARRVYFTKLRRNLNRPIFRPILPKKQILADEVFFKKEMPGEDEPLDTVRLHSLNSQNEAAEGLNTLGFTLDEFDSFRTADGSSSADLMLNTLRSSSRFGDLQLGVVISYARALNGPLLRTLALCGNRGGPNEEWWGDLAPSWEVLPWRTYLPIELEGKRWWTNPLGEALIRQGKIEEAKAKNVLNERPDREMAIMYRTNREKFNETYACQPPAAIDAYIQQPGKIIEAVEYGADALLEPIAQVTPYISEAVDTRTGKVRRFVARRLDQIRMRPDVTYFIGCDAGETQDSFALCVAHLVPPNEAGHICPACWRDRDLRVAKHYIPEPVPTLEEDPAFDPSKHACDHCGKVPPRVTEQAPNKAPAFWGFCRPSGDYIKREVVDRHGQTVTEPILVTDPVTGQQRTEDRVVYEDVYLPLVVEDLLIEWKPDKVQGLTVDFENVKDVIVQLTQHGRIGAARFDRWQATMMVQLLQKRGIDAATEWFGNPAQLGWYANHKHLLYTNQIMYQPERPDNPAYAKARVEMREVQLINNNRIDHPEESAAGGPGTKDLSDAQGLAFWLCVEHEIARAIIDLGNRHPAVAAMNRQSEMDARGAINPHGVVGQALRGLGILG